MRGLLRFRVFLLSLILVVGNLALLSHAAAHFHPQVEECELCVGETQPQAAVPPALTCIDLQRSEAHPPALPWDQPRQSRHRHDGLQRAPPIPSP